MTITNKADLIEAVCDGDLNARGSFLRDVTTVEQLERYGYDIATQEPQTFALQGGDPMRGVSNGSRPSPRNGHGSGPDPDVAGVASARPRVGLVAQP